MDAQHKQTLHAEFAVQGTLDVAGPGAPVQPVIQQHDRDHPEEGEARRHQPRLVHQEAQHHPVAGPDHEARSEDERPVVQDD